MRESEWATGQELSSFQAHHSTREAELGKLRYLNGLDAHHAGQVSSAKLRRTWPGSPGCSDKFQGRCRVITQPKYSDIVTKSFKSPILHRTGVLSLGLPM